jgi:Cd2+/Zn2+-exporting ATPase/Cu+-exporting ATPase
MNSNNKTLEIQIRGMDCSECVAHVDHALRSVPDVSDVQVLLGAEKAKVEYLSNAPDPDLIRRAVKDAGYEAIFKEESQPAESASETEKSLSRRLAMILGVVFGLVLFVAVVGEWLGLFEQLTDRIPWFAWMALIIIGGFPIFRNVIRSAVKGQVISHTLMTLGVIAAIAVREWPTAAVVVLFMRVGDFVEGLTTGNARKAVKNLTNMVPQLARVERDGQELTLPITQVNIGDVVVIRPGEAIPVDGVVIEGAAAVDQSAISGEGMPIDAEAKIKVFAASIIKTGMLKIKTTATGEDTTFGKVIRLVEEAEGNRGNVQRLADKFAGYYLPVVAVIALLTLLLRQDPLAAAATLVVACSCSFALATPVAMLASTGSAAKQGLLIKGGKYLEILAKVETLFVDKTGTLTTGNPQITDIISWVSSRKRIYCGWSSQLNNIPNTRWRGGSSKKPNNRINSMK